MKRIVVAMLTAAFLASSVSASAAEDAEPTATPAGTEEATPTAKPEATATTEPAVTAEPTATPDPNMLTDEEQKKVNTFGTKKVTKVKVKVDIAKKTKLTWNKVTGATGYRVYRATSKSGKYKMIATVKKTAYTDKKTKARKKYYYKVEGTLKIKKRTFICKKSNAKGVYVRPKNPRTVVAGECFVQDFLFIKSKFTKNTHYVYKIGCNTASMQNSNFVNYNGRTITGLERIALYNPDRVIFLLGANESAWHEPGWSINNYKKMVKRLKKINSNVQVVILAVPPFGWHSSQNIASVSKRARYNKAYKSYADKTKNVYYCPATNALADSTSHLMKKYDGGDGCHWNMTGAKTVADALKKWCKKNLHSW